MTYVERRELHSSICVAFDFTYLADLYLLHTMAPVDAKQHPQQHE